MNKKEFISKLCVWSVILGGVGVCAQASPATRACIIGAGPSGLATARFMREYGLNFTIFEATRYIGGIWRYNPRIGTDEDGWPTFPSAYKNMRTNGVLELLAFRDFPFPKGLPTFITATCFYKYLKSFTNHFDLMKYIQFRSRITGIQWTGDKWNVTYIKTDTQAFVTEECNFVTVATGEFNAPNIPYFEKQEDFKGKIIHSRDYKDVENFRDLRVLVVGAGPSAFDFLSQLMNVTSRSLHSNHFKLELPKVPGNYVPKPDIKHFTANGAVFIDDSAEEFDVAILCTGYTYNMPFLNYQSAGVTATPRYVMPLYNQVVNINHPSMTFVGAGKLATHLVHEIQGQYVAMLAAGMFQLPSQDHMFEHWFNHSKNFDLARINTIGYIKTDAYLDELLQEVDIPRPPPVIAKIIKKDLLSTFRMFWNFRDYEYKILSDTEYVKTYQPRKEVCPIGV